MKRRELKTFLLLSLPIAAIVAVAGLVSLRSVKRDLGPPYRITHHELIVGAAKLTESQKSELSAIRLKPEDCVIFLTKVESRVPTTWESWVWGDAASRAAVNNSYCFDAKDGSYIPPALSSGDSSGYNGKSLNSMTDYYSLKSLRTAKGKIRFTITVSWQEDGKYRSRPLDLIVDPATLKLTS